MRSPWDEVGRGDAEIALKRLEIINGVPLVELNQAVRNLAVQFLSRSNLPPKASSNSKFGMFILHRQKCRNTALFNYL